VCRVGERKVNVKARENWVPTDVLVLGDDCGSASRSTRCEDVSTIRRATQEVQNPRSFFPALLHIGGLT
jgi:hypothetical protein